MKIFSHYRGLPREIYVIFFARIINSAGSFVFPFMTLLLTDKIGLSASEAGSLMLLVSLSYAPGSLLGGRISDSIGRKRVMIIAHLSSALSLAACGFIGENLAIVGFIIASQFFIGALSPASIALATDLSSKENRQAAFSFLYLGHNIGFAVGPFIAGLLYANYSRWIFFGDAITTSISVFLVLLLVKETLPDEKRHAEIALENPEETKDEGRLLSALLKRPFLLLFVCAITLLNFVYAQMHFSLPIYMNGIFTDNGPRFFGIVMGANAITVITLTAPLVALTKRFRPIINTSAAGILYMIGFGMVFFARSLPFFILTTVIWTSGEIISVTNSQVYIANHTPSSHRGRFNSIIPIIMGTGFALSPALMGSFIDAYSVNLVWPLVSILAFFGSLWLLAVASLEWKRRQAAAAPPTEASSL